MSNIQELPEGWALYKNGKYLVIEKAHGHPIAGRLGRIPYHRFVLFEHLRRPKTSDCFWCGITLPWRVEMAHSVYHVVNVDHVDGDTNNNELGNLVASCAWCNTNRSWAEAHDEFWGNWRHWLREVPPVYRPNLIDIAKDCGIDAGIAPRSHKEAV
jgi:hypothetical protein